jgi:hypothetical protein
MSVEPACLQSYVVPVEASNPASFARRRHWVPAFAGTTKPFFHVSGARVFAKLRRSRGSGKPASFARTRHWVPAFAGTTKLPVADVTHLCKAQWPGRAVALLSAATRASTRIGLVT